MEEEGRGGKRMMKRREEDDEEEGRGGKRMMRGGKKRGRELLSGSLYYPLIQLKRLQDDFLRRYIRTSSD